MERVRILTLVGPFCSLHLLFPRLLGPILGSPPFSSVSKIILPYSHSIQHPAFGGELSTLGPPGHYPPGIQLKDFRPGGGGLRGRGV